MNETSEDTRERSSEHVPTTYYWKDDGTSLPTTIAARDDLATVLNTTAATRVEDNLSTGPSRGAKRNKFSIDFKVQVATYALETSNSAAGKQFNVDESLVRRWREQKPRLEALMNAGDQHKRLRLPRGTYTGRGPGAVDRRSHMAPQLQQQIEPVPAATPEYERVPALTQFVEEQSGMLTSLLTVNPHMHQLQSPEVDDSNKHGVPTQNGISYCDGTNTSSTQPHQNGEMLSSVKVYSEQDMHDPPTLADLVRCSKLINRDMPLLASAVDVTDMELDNLKQQFCNPAAQALQLLKIWQRNIGGTRGELYELIQLLSGADSAHNS